MTNVECRIVVVASLHLFYFLNRQNSLIRSAFGGSIVIRHYYKREKFLCQH
jgi:hypothetical protein